VRPATTIKREGREEATRDAAGWPRVPVGEMLSGVQAGFASGARDEKGVVQLRMNNVDTQGRFVWDRFLRVPASPAMIDEYRLRRGDVVFNNTNSTELVGKSALFQDHAEPVVYSNHFTRLRVRPGVLSPAYLSAWLNHQWQRGTFAEICNQWIGQSAVKAEKLLALSIPLPPLAEQERMAGRLTKQLAAVERARAAAQARLAAAECLPAAYLREVFEGLEAPRLELRTVSRAVTDGTHLPPPFTSCGIPFLFVRNIVAGRIDFDVKKYVSEESYAELTRKHRPERGDILFSAVGSFGVAVVVETDERFVFQRHIAHIKPDSEKIDAHFLAMFLNSADGRAQSEAVALGCAQRTVTLQDLRRFTVPLPPLPAQRQIAADLARRLGEAEHLAACIREELAAIQTLPAALLREAFGGVEGHNG